MSSQIASSENRNAVIRFLANSPKQAIPMIFGFGLVFVIASIFLTFQTFQTVEKDNPKFVKPTSKSEKLPEEETIPEKIKVTETNLLYLICLVWSSSCAILMIGIGVWQIFRLGDIGYSDQPAPVTDYDNAYRLILVGLGGLGLLTTLLGSVLSLEYREGLVQWLLLGKVKEGRPSVVAAAVGFIGLFLMLIGVLSVRGKERQNDSIRRLVFGYNTVLSGILTLILLVIINIGVGLKVPTVFDMTEKQFYSLSQTSKKIIGDLKKPVHAYLIYPQESVLKFVDLKTLLMECEDLNPNFRATYLAPGVDDDEIVALMQRLKIKDLGGPASAKNPDLWGLILTYGEREEQTSFIGVGELIVRVRSQKGPPKTVFQAESRMITELSFLTEDKRKPVLYFSQGHGEPDMMGESVPASLKRASAQLLREFLLDRKFDIRSWKTEAGAKPFDLSDADVLIILNPQAAFTAEESDVIRQYLMPNPAKKTSGGKLLAFLPPVPDPFNNGQPVQTGLEDLLRKYDIELVNEFLICQPGIRGLAPYMIPLGRINSLSRPSNDLNFLLQKIQLNLSSFSRRVNPMKSSPRPTMHLEPIVFTTDELVTWSEKSYDEKINYTSIWQNFKKDRESVIERKPATDNRCVAVLGLVTEGAPESGETKEKPKLAVFGTGDFYTDMLLNSDVYGRFRDAYLQTFVSTVDWLRERPENIGIESKPYSEFTFKGDGDKGDVNWQSTFWIPYLMVIMSIAGLGISIWVIRRS